MGATTLADENYWRLVSSPREATAPFRGWYAIVTNVDTGEVRTVEFEIRPGSAYSYGHLMQFLERQFLGRKTLPRRILIQPGGEFVELSE